MSQETSSGRIALVTGASRGLGYAVARALCMKGLTVFALARTLGGLEDLDDAVKSDGGTRPTLLPLDLTDDGAIERMGAAIFERHGKLDVLIHAAAHAPPLSPVNHIATKDLQKAWAVNARAVQQLIRSVDPLLRPSDDAKAVFFLDPREASPFWGTYSTTKSAGIGFARTWAAEVEKSGISCLFHQPPEMPTALRARFYPGQDEAGLTPCATAAQDVVSLVA